MLRLDGVAVERQGSRILHGIGLTVGERELVCLVRRNGAG